MEPTKANHFSPSLDILSVYYQKLLEYVSNEIVEHEQAFEEPLFGDGEGIIEKYARFISDFNTVYHALKSMGEVLYQRSLVILDEDQFRCFSCEKVFRRKQGRCPHCGWNWK